MLNIMAAEVPVLEGSELGDVFPSREIDHVRDELWFTRDSGDTVHKWMRRLRVHPDLVGLVDSGLSMVSASYSSATKNTAARTALAEIPTLRTDGSPNPALLAEFTDVQGEKLLDGLLFLGAAIDSRDFIRNRGRWPTIRDTDALGRTIYTSTITDPEKSQELGGMLSEGEEIPIASPLNVVLITAPPDPREALPSTTFAANHGEYGTRLVVVSSPKMEPRHARIALSAIDLMGRIPTHPYYGLGRRRLTNFRNAMNAVSTPR
jgi:hypothetical protein